MEKKEQTRTSIAWIFPFMNWFSVAARSSRSFVSVIGFRELSVSMSTCIGTIVGMLCDMLSSDARCRITSLLYAGGQWSDVGRW